MSRHWVETDGETEAMWPPTRRGGTSRPPSYSRVHESIRTWPHMMEGLFKIGKHFCRHLVLLLSENMWGCHFLS